MIRVITLKCICLKIKGNDNTDPIHIPYLSYTYNFNGKYLDFVQCDTCEVSVTQICNNTWFVKQHHLSDGDSEFCISD